MLILAKVLAIDVLNMSDLMLEKLRAITEGTDDVPVFWEFIPKTIPNPKTTPSTVVLRVEIKMYSVPDGPKKVSLVFSEVNNCHVKSQVYLGLAEFQALVEQKGEIMRAMLSPAVSI